MDIKLRARLSAYSKIESIQGMNNNNLPHPDATAEGHVLGVDANGQYTLIRRVTQEDIAEKWGQAESDTVISKNTIDTLFDKPAEVVDVLDKSTIDTLFDDKSLDGTVDVIEKETIDSLFSNNRDSSIATVSYAAIDSLFDK
jgi:hypothetical protein